MCGITGIINKRGRTINAALVQQMCRVLTHRGPDDEGIYVNHNIGMGMRRLSIIDLAAGKQPIANEDGSKWIIFNGEIYNHVTIRAELEKKGHKFKTRSDTEVILHAYEQWGEECVHKLNGMFAFTIWDCIAKRLFIARDRIGIKPLYFYDSDDYFIWGSEIKSILQVPQVPRQLDMKALDNFLTFEYVPAPRSIFYHIKKLPAGHWLRFENGTAEIRRYWDFQFHMNGASETQLIDQFRALLEDSVKIQMMSDVPLGGLLSGGLDSSTVVAFMARSSHMPVKTFSIGFDDGTYNELGYARRIAKHFQTDHHEFMVTPNIADLTEKLLEYFDEPFGDFSMFPTYWVSRLAREHVTVALSGDGGDELLGGYDAYLADRLARSIDCLVPFLNGQMVQSLVRRIKPTAKKKGFVNRIKRFLEGVQYPPDLQHVRWMIFLSEYDKTKLYSTDLHTRLANYNPYEFIQAIFKHSRNGTGASTPLTQQQYVDVMSYLVDDILVKVDRMSMATSLEARVPFLDYRFVEFIGTLPDQMKINGKQTKYILRRAMQDILPTTILTRGKEGFSIPIKNWLKTSLKPLMLEMLSEDRLRRDGLFKPEHVKKMITTHLDGRENHSHRLWALIIFNLWYLKNIQNNN